MEYEKKYDEVLAIRGQQRRKHLENPNFEKLSDTLKVDYERRREPYILMNLLCNKDCFRVLTNSETLEDAYQRYHKRPTINWPGIFDYYEERAKTLKDNDFYDTRTGEDVAMVLELLNKHRNEVLPTYSAF